jgi:hypothetical protein
VWRLVTAEPRVAALEEIEVHWTLRDVLTANEVLDAIEEARAEAHRKAAERGK